jgi:hypothetical protein
MESTGKCLNFVLWCMFPLQFPGGDPLYGVLWKGSPEWGHLEGDPFLGPHKAPLKGKQRWAPSWGHRPGDLWSLTPSTAPTPRDPLQETPKRTHISNPYGESPPKKPSRESTPGDPSSGHPTWGPPTNLLQKTYSVTPTRESQLGDDPHKGTTSREPRRWDLFNGPPPVDRLQETTIWEPTPSDHYQ